MIEKDVIKLKDVVLVYSQPPEQALVGIVENIEYPIVELLVVPREKDKFKRCEKIDLSKKISLTILTKDKQEQILTLKEYKKLQKLQKDDDVVDLFSGTY